MICSPQSYTVRFENLELSFLPFGEENEARVTMVFELSENKRDGNREY